MWIVEVSYKLTPPEGAAHLIFGGCVPLGFQNVGSKEQIFPEKLWVLGTKILKNLDLES